MGSAAKIRGAGGSAGEGAAPHSFPRKAPPPPRQHPRRRSRRRSRQHPEFSQNSSQRPPQPFSGFPQRHINSGTKKNPNLNFRVGRVGAKKFGMSLETQGIKLFWRDIPGFCRDIPPEAPEKFEKKMFGFNFNSRPLLTEAILSGDCLGRGAGGGAPDRVARGRMFMCCCVRSPRSIRGKLKGEN